MPAAKTAAAPALQIAPINLTEMWNISVAWFSAHAVQIGIAAIAGTLIYLALATVREFGKRLKRRPGDHIGLATVVGRAIARTTHFFMVIVAARLVSGYANPPVPVARTIAFLFTLAAVFQGALWLREVLLGLIERKAGEDGGSETLANATGIIRVLVTVVLFAIAAVVVLDNLGVNVTGLVAGLGIGGIAIGLAAQGIFSDLFAALSIIFDKPFRRGEIITYGTTTARVERIGLKSTRLHAMSGERKIISNANLLQKEITGLDHLSQRRVKFTLGVIYETPVEVCARIPEMLKAAVESAGDAIHFLNAGMTTFSASSLDFDLEFDIADPDANDYFMTRHRAALAVLKCFNEAGIAFAYPTQMNFTAAPDGRAILPYPEGKPA